MDNARQMVRGDDGVLFVGSRRADNVYALSDTNGGGVIDRQQLIAEDLKMHKEKESLHKNLTLMGVFCSQRFENIPIALHKPTSEYFMYLPQSPDRGAR
ncbi:MAG: hypothetical protein L3J24_13035 [Xanthomonadales bacterium]|nr:hypothetical protein [Xanthomonadales bacterium]